MFPEVKSQGLLLGRDGYSVGDRGVMSMVGAGHRLRANRVLPEMRLVPHFLTAAGGLSKE